MTQWRHPDKPPDISGWASLGRDRNLSAWEQKLAVGFVSTAAEMRTLQHCEGIGGWLAARTNGQAASTLRARCGTAGGGTRALAKCGVSGVVQGAGGSSFPGELRMVLPRSGGRSSRVDGTVRGGDRPLVKARPAGEWYSVVCSAVQGCYLNEEDNVWPCSGERDSVVDGFIRNGRYSLVGPRKWLLSLEGRDRGGSGPVRNRSSPLVETQVNRTCAVGLNIYLECAVQGSGSPCTATRIAYLTSETHGSEDGGTPVDGSSLAVGSVMYPRSGGLGGGAVLGGSGSLVQGRMVGLCLVGRGGADGTVQGGVRFIVAGFVGVRSDWSGLGGQHGGGMRRSCGSPLVGAQVAWISMGGRESRDIMIGGEGTVQRDGSPFIEPEARTGHPEPDSFVGGIVQGGCSLLTEWLPGSGDRYSGIEGTVLGVGSSLLVTSRLWISLGGRNSSGGDIPMRNGVSAIAAACTTWAGSGGSDNCVDYAVLGDEGPLLETRLGYPGYGGPDSCAEGDSSGSDSEGGNPDGDDPDGGCSVGGHSDGGYSIGDESGVGEADGSDSDRCCWGGGDLDECDSMGGDSDRGNFDGGDLDGDNSNGDDSDTCDSGRDDLEGDGLEEGDSHGESSLGGKSAVGDSDGGESNGGNSDGIYSKGVYSDRGDSDGDDLAGSDLEGGDSEGGDLDGGDLDRSDSDGGNSDGTCRHGGYSVSWSVDRWLDMVTLCSPSELTCQDRAAGPKGDLVVGIATCLVPDTARFMDTKLVVVSEAEWDRLLYVYPAVDSKAVLAQRAWQAGGAGDSAVGIVGGAGTLMACAPKVEADDWPAGLATSAVPGDDCRAVQSHVHSATDLRADTKLTQEWVAGGPRDSDTGEGDAVGPVPADLHIAGVNDRVPGPAAGGSGASRNDLLHLTSVLSVDGSTSDPRTLDPRAGWACDSETGEMASTGTVLASRSQAGTNGWAADPEAAGELGVSRSYRGRSPNPWARAHLITDDWLAAVITVLHYGEAGTLFCMYGPQPTIGSFLDCLIPVLVFTALCFEVVCVVRIACILRFGCCQKPHVIDHGMSDLLQVDGSDSGGGDSGGGDSGCGDLEDGDSAGDGDLGDSVLDGDDSGEGVSGGSDSGGGDAGGGDSGGGDSGGDNPGGGDSVGGDAGGAGSGVGDLGGGDFGSGVSDKLAQLFETGVTVSPAPEPKAGSAAEPGPMERDDASSQVNATAAQLIGGDTAPVATMGDGRHVWNVTEVRSASMDSASTLLPTVPRRIMGSVGSLGGDRDPSDAPLLVIGLGGTRHFSVTRDISCRDFLDQVSRCLGAKLQLRSLGRLVPWRDGALLDFLGPDGWVLKVGCAVDGGAPTAQEPSDSSRAMQDRSGRYNLRTRQGHGDSDETEWDPPLCKVYELGTVPEQDVRDWKKLLSCFHADQELSDKCKECATNIRRYFSPQLNDDKGLHFVAVQFVPPGTRFGFFAGCLQETSGDVKNNYRMSLGSRMAGYEYTMELNCDPSHPATKQCRGGGIGGLLNHSCQPTCETRLEDVQGVGFVQVSVGRNGLQKGEEATISYQDSYKEGYWLCAFNAVRQHAQPGFVDIDCGCNGQLQCPNGYYRLEWRKGRQLHFARAKHLLEVLKEEYAALLLPASVASNSDEHTCRSLKRRLPRLDRRVSSAGVSRDDASPKTGERVISLRPQTPGGGHSSALQAVKRQKSLLEYLAVCDPSGPDGDVPAMGLLVEAPARPGVEGTLMQIEGKPDLLLSGPFGDAKTPAAGMESALLSAGGRSSPNRDTEHTCNSSEEAPTTHISHQASVVPVHDLSICSRRGSSWGDRCGGKMRRNDRIIVSGDHEGAREVPRPRQESQDYHFLRLAEAEQTLVEFDRNSDWGPSSSLTRMERWRRGVSWVKNADAWKWVEDLLLQFPELANRKPNALLSADPPHLHCLARGERGSMAVGPAVRIRPQAAKQQSPGRHNVGDRHQRRLVNSSDVGTVTSGEGDDLKTGDIKTEAIPSVPSVGSTLPRAAKRHRSILGYLAESLPVDLPKSERPACGKLKSTAQGPATNVTLLATSQGAPGASRNRARGGPRLRSLADFFHPTTLLELSPSVPQGEPLEQQRPRLESDVDTARPGEQGGVIQGPLGEASASEEAVIPTPELPSWAHPWRPGFPLPPIRRRGGPGREGESGFPVWPTLSEDPQKVMFQAADKIQQPAFYVAADIWRKGACKKQDVTKVYGAYRTPEHFLDTFSRTQIRCFYEIVREGLPCKGYLDLEASAGDLTQEEGNDMLRRTTLAWETLVAQRWPECFERHPQARQFVVLNGGRSTGGGWKVSFHVVFPWLSFPSNDGDLRQLGTALSRDPALQYTNKKGESVPFVDSGVYSANRLIRTALSCKLVDPSWTPLQFSAHEAIVQPTRRLFLLSCITRLEQDSFLAPPGDMVREARCLPTPRLRGRYREDGHLPRQPAEEVTIPAIRALLATTVGVGGGTFKVSGDTGGALAFRWQAPEPRPCIIAQLWRPSDPNHASNGALILCRPDGRVFLRCLHPRCQLLEEAPGQHLGELPPDVVRSTFCRPGQSGSREYRKPISEASGGDTGQLQTAHLQGGGSMDQCLARTCFHNQKVDEGGFSAPSLTEPEGVSVLEPWPHSAAPLCQERDEQRLLDWINADDFTGSPPQSARRTLCAILRNKADEYAVGQGRALEGWREVAAHEREEMAAGAGDAVGDGAQFWECLPPEDWFLTPAGRRSRVGPQLILEAQLRAAAELGPGLGASVPDLQTGAARARDTRDYDHPFRVASLNVGFVGLSKSARSICALVHDVRPDILFLGDLRTTRNQIGRVRRVIESATQAEWMLLSDVAPDWSYPGLGVLIHASLDSQVCTMELERPDTIPAERWLPAVQGRIIHLKLSRPLTPHTCWFVGIYQHVADSVNDGKREILLGCLADIKRRAERENVSLFIIGDANSAPTGGRWFYSKQSKVYRADAMTTTWLRSTGLSEALPSPLSPTWKANQHPRCALLDRAWFWPGSVRVSAKLRWGMDDQSLDHAMVFIDIPRSTAGAGLAGACRGISMERAPPRCKADLNTLRLKREEWVAAVRTRLLKLKEVMPVDSDPYQALAAALEEADAAAQEIAPRSIGRGGQNGRQRPFVFAGDRTLCREISWIAAARRLVYAALHRIPFLVEASERETVWRLSVCSLSGRLRRSNQAQPSPLCGPLRDYLDASMQPALRVWLDDALEAIRVRREIIRGNFERAMAGNLKKLRGLMRANPGTLNSDAIQTALGKPPIRQRVWALMGCVHTGLAIETQLAEVTSLLADLGAMGSAVSGVCRVARTSEGLQLWFTGPRLLGDFLLKWCTLQTGRRAPVTILRRPDPFLAVCPDDIAAVQELYLSEEGMSRAALCPECRGSGLVPVVTSAEAQCRGSPYRAVRFWCQRCHSIHDEPVNGPPPKCPIPPEVWAALRKFPGDMPPFLSRPMDRAAVRNRARKLPTGRAPGSDGKPYEYIKLGPEELLEFVLPAANAFLSRSHPLPTAWLGALLSLAPKSPGAVTMKGLRPLSNIITSVKFCTAEVAERMSRTFEEYGVLQEPQEGARRGRGAKRQVLKLQQIYEIAKRGKLKIAALYVDYNIAFTGTNHDCVYETAEATGVPRADIELLKSLDRGAWYAVGNTFGVSAACCLERGFMQGKPTSPILFNFAPMNTLIAYLTSTGKGWRTPQSSGWYERGSEARSICSPAPVGPSDPASAYLDDMAVITVGPNTVADMQVLVACIVLWEPWSGVTVNLDKTRITAIDFASGRVLATDSILYKGSPFMVILPSEPFKYLGVRTTLTLDPKFEKEHVLQEMDKRLAALGKATALSASHRLRIIEFGIASVFRFSAGLTPWTRAELEKIQSKWVQGGKRAWTMANGTESSLIRLCERHGGRACTNAVEVWTNDATGLIEQCRRIPGVIATMMEASLQRACRDHGCGTLFQLQRALRLVARPTTVVENLLCRLDERGLDVHGVLPPVAHTMGPLIMEVLWPQLWEARQKREDHVGCTELPEAMQVLLDEAKRCLSAIRALASFGILHVSQLLSGDRSWLAQPSVAQTKVAAIDYSTMTRWLGTPGAEVAAWSGQLQLWQEPPGRPLSQPALVPQGGPVVQSFPVIDSRNWIVPAHVDGRAVASANHVITLVPTDRAPADDPSLLTEIAMLSDDALARLLCESRAVLFPTNRPDLGQMVECLSPVSAIAPRWSGNLKLVLGEFGTGGANTRLVTASLAMIRQWLTMSGRLTVRTARWRPPWSVSKCELERYFELRPPSTTPPGFGPGSLTAPVSPICWQLHPPADLSRQRILRTTSALPSTGWRRQAPNVCGSIPDRVFSELKVHPWQCDPPLPGTVSFDFLTDTPVPLPCPEGWVILQRNGSVVFSNPAGVTCQMEAAQFHMLAWLGREVETPVALDAIQKSCEAQSQADSWHHVPWSRHFLAGLAEASGAKGLVGSRAATFHPHFQWYVSPDPADVVLGAREKWPEEQCVLILDWFLPSLRHEVLRRAFNHPAWVWILRLDKPCPESRHDKNSLTRLKACHYARIPKGSWILQAKEGWSEARLDEVRSSVAAEVWRTGRGDARAPFLSSADFRRALGSWEEQREDFHWPTVPVPYHLAHFRAALQDSHCSTWESAHPGAWVGATDGSFDKATETMGAGATVGLGKAPDKSIWFAVGGPLSPLRAEAAALDGLLQETPDNTPLLVLIDCLVLLWILARWGSLDFWPDPEDIPHLDIIGSCLQRLRLRTAATRLVKIKGHSGLLLNVRADALADLGRSSEEVRWPGPRKLSYLQLRARESLRHADASFPADSVADKKLIVRAVENTDFAAAKLKQTSFSRSFLQDLLNCGPVFKAVSGLPDHEIRVWMQAASNTYPTMSLLHKMQPSKYPSPNCPFCHQGVPETLGHFTSSCPHFHDAYTAAHDRSWNTISRVVEKYAPSCWKFYHECPIGTLGLIDSRNLLRCYDDGTVINVGALRADTIGVSLERKKLAILDHCRPFDGEDAPGEEEGSDAEEDSYGENTHVPFDGMGTALTDDAQEHPAPSAGGAQHHADLLCYTRASIRRAGDRKRLKYQLIVDALEPLTADGWKVEVLPWVAGVRGILDTQGIGKAARFLDIPQAHHTALLQKSALASVESLVFLHRVRYAPQQPSSFDKDNPPPSSFKKHVAARRTLKRLRHDAKDCLQRWKRLRTDVVTPRA